MSDDTRGFKGVWFPSHVWLDERLSALDKIILLEIDSLDNDDGCYASNEYLARFCQCSQRKVSDAISKLKELGYVKVVSFDGRTRILHACLAESAGETSKICEAPSQNLRQRILEESSSKSTRGDMGAKRKKGMRVPTRDEVRAYVNEKGYHFDPDHFYDYYEGSNWHLQSGKRITSWKQCCVTWERRARDDEAPRGRRREASGRSEPKVGTVRYDSATGIKTVYKGKGVWKEEEPTLFDGVEYEDITYDL